MIFQLGKTCGFPIAVPVHLNCPSDGIFGYFSIVSSENVSKTLRIAVNVFWSSFPLRQF